MAEVLKLEEQYAIVSEAERSTTPVRVLKHGDSFAVFDPHGDVIPGPASEHGLYHAGTRFLSRFELLLAGGQPLLLSSNVSEDNAVFTADLTNPDVLRDGHVIVPRGAGARISFARPVGWQLDRVPAGLEPWGSVRSKCHFPSASTPISLTSSKCVGHAAANAVNVFRM
jgi:hypothetical protein